jgi:hypothetical protein
LIDREDSPGEMALWLQIAVLFLSAIAIDLAFVYIMQVIAGVQQ